MWWGSGIPLGNKKVDRQKVGYSQEKKMIFHLGWRIRYLWRKGEIKIRKKRGKILEGHICQFVSS